MTARPFLLSLAACLGCATTPAWMPATVSGEGQGPYRLVASLTVPNERARAEAELLVLGDRVIPALQDSFKACDEPLARESARLLVQIGGPRSEVNLPVLDSARCQTQLILLEALAATRGTEALDLLQLALGTLPVESCEKVERLILSLGAPAAAEALLQGLPRCQLQTRAQQELVEAAVALLAAPASPDVAALVALATTDKLGSRPPALSKLVTLEAEGELVSLVTAEQVELRAATLDALEAASGRWVAGVLGKALLHPDPGTHERARELLAARSEPEATAALVPALLRPLDRIRFGRQVLHLLEARGWNPASLEERVAIAAAKGDVAAIRAEGAAAFEALLRNIETSRCSHEDVPLVEQLAVYGRKKSLRVFHRLLVDPSGDAAVRQAAASTFYSVYTLACASFPNPEVKSTAARVADAQRPGEADLDTLRRLMKGCGVALGESAGPNF